MRGVTSPRDVRLIYQLVVQTARSTLPSFARVPMSDFTTTYGSLVPNLSQVEILVGPSPNTAAALGRETDRTSG